MRLLVKILSVALVLISVLATVQYALWSTKSEAPRIAHFGGIRAFEVNVPENYSASKPTGIVIALHGFGSSGVNVENYFGLAALTNKYGLLSVAPNGTFDKEGRRFWNATPACCNVDHIKVDDERYLVRLLDVVSERFNLDSKRIYIIGFSNGGFMAHRMACNQAGRIAAIVSVAGSTYVNKEDCKPSEPVSMIQVHGTADQTIAFEGGVLRGEAFPGAEAVSGIWAELDSCKGRLVTLQKRYDFDSSVTGSEAKISIHAPCSGGTNVQLWTINEGRHFLRPTKAFGEQVMKYFIAHPKLTF